MSCRTGRAASALPQNNSEGKKRGHSKGMNGPKSREETPKEGSDTRRDGAYRTAPISHRSAQISRFRFSQIAGRVNLTQRPRPKSLLLLQQWRCANQCEISDN